MMIVQHNQQNSVSSQGAPEDYSVQLNQQFMHMKQSFEQLRKEKTVLERALRTETQMNQETNIKV
jgi:hypothetical protein